MKEPESPKAGVGGCICYDNTAAAEKGSHRQTMYGCLLLSYNKLSCGSVAALVSFNLFFRVWEEKT